LLIRDYFQQGFYPDGVSTNTGNASDQVLNVSGALVKATLVASAVFLDRRGQGPAPGGTVTTAYRFNNEQGYGGIDLDKVLPLKSWSKSPTGLIVADGGIAGGRNDTGLSGTANSGVTETWSQLNVCDKNQELRVALAWIEDSGDSLVHDLDLELQSPSGRVYY